MSLQILIYIRTSVSESRLTVLQRVSEFTSVIVEAVELAQLEILIWFKRLQAGKLTPFRLFFCSHKCV